MRVALISALVLYAGSAHAEGGTLEGRVSDPSGSALVGATVSAKGASAEKGTTSGASGEYMISGLAPGTYTVTILKEGFSPYGNTSVAVGPDRTTLDVSLALAPLES